MANLKDIRDRIKSIKSIQQVTGAMKMVAAAKMRKAQERMEQARPYSNRLSELIKELLPDVDRDLLPLLDTREKSRYTYVVITSDRGLAGSFNTNVLKTAQKEIDDLGKENVDLICIGKKARDHFKSREYNIISEYLDFWNELSFDHAIQYGNLLLLNQKIQKERVKALKKFNADAKKNNFAKKDNIVSISKAELDIFLKKI